MQHAFLYMFCNVRFCRCSKQHKIHGHSRCLAANCVLHPYAYKIHLRIYLHRNSTSCVSCCLTLYTFSKAVPACGTLFIFVASIRPLVTILFWFTRYMLAVKWNFPHLILGELNRLAKILISGRIGIFPPGWSFTTFTGVALNLNLTGTYFPFFTEVLRHSSLSLW